MTPATYIASLATAAFVGAAGYAALSGAPVGGTAHASAAAADSGTAASRTEAPASQRNDEGTSSIATPRQCRPEQGIDHDCEYL